MDLDIVNLLTQLGFPSLISYLMWRALEDTRMANQKIVTETLPQIQVSMAKMTDALDEITQQLGRIKI